MAHVENHPVILYFRERESCIHIVVFAAASPLHPVSVQQGVCKILQDFEMKRETS